MYPVIKQCLVAATMLAAPIAAVQDPAPAGSIGSRADQLARSIDDPQLRSLVAETLERNPGVAVLQAKARAAASRAPQARGLPDPVVGATAWLQGAETRTGPQVLTVNLMQPLPWLGRFDAAEQGAVLEARALFAEAEARRLELVTSVRRLYYELAFLARQRAVSEDFLDHLRQHEKISLSRYATGIGSTQDVIKIQAETTLAEKLLMDIDRHRIALEAELNALRDRSASTVILPAILPPGRAVELDYGDLSIQAATNRPEVTAAEARIAGSESQFELAEKQSRPDFAIGLTYTFVDTRQDAAGQLMPPAGNGDDILGIQGAISVPIWRKKRSAAVVEASESGLAARENKRRVLAEIEASLGGLLQRIPLTWSQLRLLEDVLILQAGESVRSAQSSYVSGTLNALDLLDAEHVLFEAETAIARTLADYAIYLAELEGAVAIAVNRAEPKELSVE